MATTTVVYKKTGDTLIQAAEMTTARARAVIKAKTFKADSKVAATTGVNTSLNLKMRTWTNGVIAIDQASLKAVLGPVTPVDPTLKAIMTLGLVKVAESRTRSERATKTTKTMKTSKI